jgi:hypothetical protein
MVVSLSLIELTIASSNLQAFLATNTKSDIVLTIPSTQRGRDYITGAHGRECGRKPQESNKFR